VPEVEAEAVRRALDSRVFRAQLVRAIRKTVMSRAGLKKVVLMLTR
jgi:hypothetical protein